MTAYTLSQRTIPLQEEWDVLVIGGGPAGCAAAISAAREGARTLLIEATGALGGMGTSGLVPAWTPFSDGEKIVYKGIAEAVFVALKSEMPHIDKNATNWVAINPEKLKRIYDRMVTEAGAQVLFNTMVCAVDTDGAGGIQAVIVNNKAGLTAYRAGVYVDCTGDADLAAWAGAEFQKGDEDDGSLQPATHCFTMGNVDEYAYRHGVQLNGWKNPASPVHAIIASGKYPLLDHHMCNSLVAPRTVGFNAGHIQGVDNTDPHSVSQALIKGRIIAEEVRKSLAEYCPDAFGNAFVAATAPLMGIRESRRIVGDYVLQLEDYVERKSFEDEICRNSYFIDVHGSRKKKLATGKDEEYYTHVMRYGPGDSHGIPYRCLTPKGIRNMLVAGRSISCERMVLGSVRVMPVCLAMGEAAGLAAAMAAKLDSHDVHAVDTKRLRERLKEEGAYIH
ncbi:FAD-dependent oxidoreductase [Paenibacillus sp. YN15]|uniref:FAD-dependent oxidoreductase n=1 Tax=Paenibacillus sp. YN15 TaxID=1742774 RepID=UPI000DCDBB5A|nr:FAD-dependent oxidoreductase [Paenibacillus sp. YN15]RAV02323.1 FAD-dependent oxidoreductase [Paenibacillus sp. YN15]